MKTSITLLLTLIIYGFTEAKAQRKDSLVVTTLMKRASQIYVAEIETKFGIQKGILYEADSSEIVILDSLYQRVKIALYEMKSLKIYRSNAVLHGAKIGFLIPSIPFTAIGILFFVSSGVLFNGFTEAYFIVGLLAGAIGGIVLAISNSLIPHTTIRNTVNFNENYYRKLRYFKFKTQESLIKRHPNKIRLVYHN